MLNDHSVDVVKPPRRPGVDALAAVTPPAAGAPPSAPEAIEKRRPVVDLASLRSFLAFAASSPAVHAVTLVSLGLLLLFGSTALSIAAIWERSETFAHGYIVIPMCIWLAWRQRDSVVGLTARPWWPGVGFVFLAGALWLVARAASAQVVQQFALAFMLQAAIVAVVGTRIAAALVFPIAFLLFAVPAGEAFVPTLIEWTADFTVAALRWSGVPVYREANHFIIPSGAWSVVEACSGIRYIIASAMVGTVYAAVGFRSWKRRAGVLAASLLVPIVANWLRAYMIVMIGHLSSNRLAVGVDHIIYGWLFFGLVMLLFFWVASRWQDQDVALATADVPAGPSRSGVEPARTAPMYSAAMVAVAVAALWLPVDHALFRASGTELVELKPLPGQNGWVPVDAPLSAWKPQYSGYASQVQQTFQKGPNKVGVYVAYFHDQQKGRELITSTNVLVTMKDWNWRQTVRDTASLDWAGSTAPVRRFDLVGSDVRLNIYRFYWIDGQLTANDYMAKFLTSWSKLRGRGDDSAVIVLSTTEAAGDARNDEVLQSFARDMSPSMEQWLTLARSSAS